MPDEGVGISASSRVPVGAERVSRCGILEHLHRDQYAFVVREFRRITRSLHEAQDLAQETFLKVCEAIARGGVCDPVGYLWVAVRNRARNWVRDRREHLSLEEPERWLTSPRSRMSAEAGMCVERRRRALLRGIRRLSPAQREVYALVELKGLTEREAGQVLGRGRSTVSEMRARGLKKLRREFSLAGSC
jgi:RNA polymerase sigma-19 factor, ECF subfamily